jgi:hypothetical protein
MGRTLPGSSLSPRDGTARRTPRRSRRKVWMATRTPRTADLQPVRAGIERPHLARDFFVGSIRVAERESGRPACALRIDRPALARDIIRVYAERREDGRETEDRQAPGPGARRSAAAMRDACRCRPLLQMPVRARYAFMTPDRFVGSPL